MSVSFSHRIYAQFILTAVFTLYERIKRDTTEHHVLEDLQLLEKVHGIFINIRAADREGTFPPFAVTEALIRSLISSIK